MIRAVGTRYSPDWYDTALLNLGRMAGRPGFGRGPSMPGLKLFAGTSGGNGHYLAIDLRGPGFTRFQATFPFSCRVERRAAFALAIRIYALLLTPPPP